MALTNQKLEWIITEYGETRINQLLDSSDEHSRIRICSMDIGSNNSGTLEQRGALNSLLDKKNVKPIPVIEKGIATDRENTVYFKVIIDENMCGYEISELALFAEDPKDGTLQMFAVGVGEAINKPHIKNGYLMTIEYTLYIESINLLDVYDKIELDPENEFLKEVDIDNLYRTILYVEGNLAEQISNNTRAIGMSRVKEISELIDDTKLHYHTASISNYYSSLSNSVVNLSNILGFWSFHYTDAYGITNTIKDFGLNGNYMSTNSLISSYDQEYQGVLSSLNFKGQDSFNLSPVHNALVLSNNIELGVVVNPEIVDKALFSVDTKTWSLSGGVELTEDEFQRDVCTYYLRATNVYFPEEGNTGTMELPMTSEGVSIGSACYAPHTWTYKQNLDKWVNEMGLEYTVNKFKEFIVAYEGEPANEDMIYTSTTKIPDSRETIILTGKQFDLTKWYYHVGRGTYITNDSPFTFLAVLKHNAERERNIILAQSDDFAKQHNFEFIRTENNAIEINLYSGVKDKVISFRTIDNIVPSSVYSLIITYNPRYYGEFNGNVDPIVNVIINDKTYNTTIIKKEGYEGMKHLPMETTSYINTLENGLKVKSMNINSQMCLMCLIKEELDVNTLRCNSFVLNSLCGKNVYYRI